MEDEKKEPTNEEVVEDVDADTRDDSEVEGKDSDEVVRDTDYDTGEIDRKLDELFRRIDAIGAILAKMTLDDPDVQPVNVETEYVPIDKLDLD